MTSQARSSVLLGGGPAFDGKADHLPSHDDSCKADGDREDGHGVQAMELDRCNAIMRAVHEKDATRRQE